MTKVSNRLDLSFLNEEEVSKILAVLERDEQLKRAERDRVSKLQSTKRDIKWLHGVSGEWFEEIQRKKFRNDPDVSSILRQPLTYRLRKTTRYDSTDFKMSRTKSQKNTATSPSILGFRSPFTSLFSFRKLEKQSAKPQSQHKGHGIFSLTGHSTSGTGRNTKIGMSDSPQNVHTSNLFGTNLGRMRGRTMSPTDAELEDEAFHVLDDLDNKLAHEQTQSFTSYKAPMSHKPRRQYQSQYVMESGYSDTLEHQKDYRKTSSMYLHDGRRKLSFNEEYRTCSTYRPSKFHDMYSNRHRTVSHHDFTRRDTFGRSPSLSSISHGRPCSSPASFTTLSASSLHLPSLRQSNSGFLPRSSHQEAKRKPISSIIWNNPHCNEHAQNHGVLPKTHSLMELNSCANQDISPLPLQQNRMYDFYQSKNLYRRPMSKAYHFGRNQVTSPVFWNNPDHNPFYQSEYNAREFYGRAISQEGVMEIDNCWETENKENYSSSHPYSRDIIPSPYIRSHSNCNDMITNVNEQELAPANNIVHHSQHSFASTFMPADDDMVEEMKDDLDFQPLSSENARNKPFAEEINAPKIFNTTIDLKNQNSLGSNSTITLNSFIPGISTTSESVESRDQIKCNGQHEDSIANVLDTDVNVNQLQFPFTEGTTEMEVQTHLSENGNMQSVHETHIPTISNNTVDHQNSPHGATRSISSVGISFDSKDQIKPCAQCSDLHRVGTCASKNDSHFHVTQVNTDQDIQMCVEENSDMDPSNKTSYCIANASKKYIIPQPIYSRVASRSTSNLQSSQSNISASALNASIPNITKELAVHSLNSRDQSKTEPMQKNANVQTSNYFETTVLRKGNDFRSTSKNNQYTSLLLINQSRNSLSLSNLNQLKHFHQNSSEMSDMKLENMKQESTRNPNGPDSQIQEQSSLGKCIQKGVVNTAENTAALSDSFCNVLPNHKDKLLRLPKVSSEHSQNLLPDPLPSNIFTYLDTPIISSLNCKNTEAPNVGREQPVMRCHIEENITRELSQKQLGVANEEHSSEPTVSYSRNKNGETAHAPSFSDVQGQSGFQSKQAVSQTFLLSSKEAFPDPNTNRQHAKLTISCKPTRLFQDAKTIKKEYLNNLVPNNLVKISNNLEDSISNDTVPATCMLSQHLNLISTNEDTQNRTQTSPDLNRYTHLESMWLDKRISSNEDVVPCTKMASSEVSPLSSESILAKQKRIHSALPEKSFTIITDLTECKPNNTHSPEKENEDLSSTDSINTNEKLQNSTTNSCTSVSHCPNDDTSVKPSALYCSIRRSADDINTLPRYKSTAISSSSSKLLFPSRRTLDQLPARLFNRIVAPFSRHERISTVSNTEHSPLTAKPLEVHTDVNKNTRQEKHHPEEVYKSEYPISNPTSIDNVSVKADESVRTHPCPSDGLDKESNLQKRETNSTVFVSSDPGNNEYQQSRSVYSSLPNKLSGALTDVLLNRRNANLLCPNSTGNKNYEFHIKVATLTFPDSLNSKRPESSDKILSNSSTQQHSNFANKLNSRSVCTQEDIAQPPRPPLLSRPTQPTVHDADVPVQAQNASLAVEKSLNDARSMANTENIRTYFSIISGSHEKTDDLSTRIPLRFNSSVPEKAIPCQEQEASGANDATDHLQTRDLKKWQQFENARSNHIKKNVLQIYSPEDTNRNFHKGQKQTDIKPEATYSENTPVECGQKEKSEVKGGGNSIYKEISPGSERSDLNVGQIGYCRGTIDNEITSATTVLSNSNNSSRQAFCQDPTPTLQRFQPSVRNVIGTEISYEQNRTEQEPMAEEQIIDKKVTDLQMSVKPFGVHKDYFEDEVFDVSPELQLSTKAPKCNNVIFDYTNSGNTIGEKLIDSVYKTEWDAYPRTNPNYSSQNLSQAHYAINDALHKEGNISYVDISKPQNASVLPSHRQSLHDSGNHSQVLKRSSNVTTTSTQRINQNKNVFKDRSKPISPTAHCSERPTMHRKSWKNKINGSKRSTVEEVVGHTKPSFYSTNLQNERIAAKNRNIQMFNVTADSSNVHNSLDSYQDSPLMISSVDNNSNTITKKCRQPSMCVQQEDTSLGECGSMNEYQDIYQSKNFKNLNLLDDTADMMDMKKYSRRFSSATSFDRVYSRCPSISTFSPDGKKPRNFSSFSEVSSNDVNDNWTFCYNRNKSYNTRKNKSIDFGIFGKEQQAAFLENIRRSLTEGRLWRPCFLKNPGFLRNEINTTSNRSGFLSASSPGSRMSTEGLSLGEPLNIYQEEAVIYSESDNDTTTDDEYYLDDYDKESEL